MATDIILPKIGFSMMEAVLAEWLVEDGATVAAGTPLYAIEIDQRGRGARVRHRPHYRTGRRDV